MKALSLILFCAAFTLEANSGSPHFQKGLEHYLRLQYKPAEVEFIEATKENDAEAFTLLAFMCYRGEFGPKDLNKAWGLAAEGLRRGDKKANYVQGVLWEEKTKQPNSLLSDSYFRNAIPAMQESAETGNIFWTTRLAYCYNNGLGVATDHAKALALYEKGVTANYAIALHNTGYMYLHGHGMPVDYERALKFFRKSASLGLTNIPNGFGSETGIYDVAYAYHNGDDNFPPDHAKAMQLYLECIRYEYAPAYTGIGRLLNQNFPKAKEYLEKGIAGGDGEAATELALHYLDRDTATSRHYYELALKMSDNTGYPEAGLSHLCKSDKSKAQRFAFIALSKGAPSQYVNIPEVSAGEEAPDFELQNEHGETVALSGLRGKYVLIDFWASWCGPCRNENPKMVKLYNEFQNNGFEILGVSLDHDKGRWIDAIASDGLSWVHVSDLQGWNSAAGKLYSIDAIPNNLLLDKTGTVIARDLDLNELRSTLLALIPQK